MFDGGQIVESGSHDELMPLNGKYAEMYRVQAKKYIHSALNHFVTNEDYKTKKRKAELVLSNPHNEWYNTICFAKVNI